MHNNTQYIASLIKRKFIREEYVESDIITLETLDEDFVGGYKPMIFRMDTLVDIITGEVDFIDLNDTPDAFGTPGQSLVVNQDGDGLIFTDYLTSFLELNDTPLNYTGSAGLHLVVNQAEDGIEFELQQEGKYEANISFSGTNNPVVNQVFRNTLGVTISWTRTSAGIYIGTFSSNINNNMMTSYIANSSSGVFNVGAINSGSIQLIHINHSGATSDPSSIISLELKLFP